MRARWLIAALWAGLTGCTAEILPSQVAGLADTGVVTVGDATPGLDVASSTTADGGLRPDAVGLDALPGDRGDGALPDTGTATAADAGAGDATALDVGVARDAAPLDLGVVAPDALPLDVGAPVDASAPADTGLRPDGGTIPDAGGVPDA